MQSAMSWRKTGTAHHWMEPNPWWEPTSEFKWPFCSNSTMNSRKQSKQHWNSFRTIIWKSLSCPAKAQNWILFENLWTWRLLFTTAPHLTFFLKDGENMQGKNGRKSPNPDGQHWYRYPRRLKAVIAAEGASSKYWLKVANAYVN